MSKKEQIGEKISCVNIISILFPKVTNENKDELIKILIGFLNESFVSPMIKIETAIELKTMIIYFNKEQMENIIHILLENSNDSIRIHILKALASLISVKLNKIDCSDLIRNCVVTLTSDESWRVRYTVVENFSDLIEVSNDKKLLPIFIECFIKLLNDNEGEVQNMCCKNLKEISSKLSKDENFSKVLEQLNVLENSKINYVSLSFAQNVLKICPYISNELVMKYIYPIYSDLIKNDSHEIRMALLKTLDYINGHINIDTIISNSIPSLMDVSTNTNWRIRLEATEIIPVLSKIINKKTFVEGLFKICFDWLTDPVYAIREIACKLVKDLHELYKGEEFENKLLEKINEMKVKESYLIRITLTNLILKFISEEDNEFFDNKLLPIIIKLSKDKITNVRIKCAIILKKISKYTKSKEALKCLEDLKKDKEDDVVYAIMDN